MDAYQIVKDFAGPAATTIAAIVAASVTGTLSYRQWKVAQLQAGLASEKVKLEHFNAKLDVVSACQEIANILSGDIDPKSSELKGTFTACYL